MRVQPLVRVLRSSAAIGALVLGAAEANAACTTVGGVVTCSDGNISDQVNASVNAAPPPSVSLVIAEGATVARGSIQTIAPSGFRFPGAIGYTNSGVVGAANANVDFLYFGASAFNGVAVPTNTFTFTNSGVQNGTISAFNVGGAISGTNSGTVTRGIDLRGAGAIGFTNTGTVFNTGTFSDGLAITLTSSLSTSRSGADGVFRSSETGGAITATIDGSVGTPASATAAFQPQGVTARSVGGVVLAINGQAGGVSASSAGNVFENLVSFTSVGDTNISVQSFDNRSIGADARATIGAAGRVANVSVLAGTGTAIGIVNGTVNGNNFGFGGLNVNATGGESSSRSTNSSSFNPFAQNSSFTASERSTGGAALAEISSTGRVNGGVFATSNAASATIRVAGRVEATNSQSSANSTGVNSTRQGRSAGRPDGSSDGSSSSTQALSGGAALVAVTATGDISVAFLSATGDASATVDNAGRIRASVFATSNGFVETSSSSSNTGTVATDAGGTRTEINRFESTATTESLGGAATINNRLDATVQGSVQASGARGATLDNAGTITGGVFLNSGGSRTVTVGANSFITTATPASGGGTNFTSVQTSSTDATSRATGGAVTGIYSGTVGVVQPDGSFGFGQIFQSGTTTSTATVTGTLIADFTGAAAGQNRDAASTSNSRQTTERDGSTTRAQSSTSRETVTQTATTSTLTVAATGRIVGNASANGSDFVDVTSGGGNAVFTLDGGRVDRSVSVTAGANLNTVQVSEFGSTSTRAATTNNFFVPEIQQSQTNSSSFDERDAAGTAVATLNGGTIGGDLFVAGTGTGAGSPATSVLVNGTVTGGVFASGPGLDGRGTNSTVSTRTGPTTVVRTVTSTSVQTPSALAGNVLVGVNGAVGGRVDAAGRAGSATVNLAGRVGGTAADGVSVTAFDLAFQRESAQTFTGQSFFFGEQLTSSRTTNASTVFGGAATLNIAAGPELRTAGGSSVEGEILVQGLAASTLDIAAGSRIVQNAGAVFVGATFTNPITATTGTFTGGRQTGSTSTTTATAFGGPATITNAGIVGSVARPASVTVTGVGGAALVNTGTINGSVTAAARSASRVTATTTTGLNTAESRTVSINTLTAVGGAARIDNRSLITGGVAAIGATGEIVNSGVVSGTATLGGGFNNAATTTTTTFTPTGPASATAPSVANPTLFTQTYTLNQNGLLLGGVGVTGTTTLDASGAAVRTSNVNATVNLNNGSVTLGNVTAEAASVTNVNLNGSGFLGVAANDATGAPLGSVVTGFQPTPSLARFAAIDPSLGVTTAPPPGSRVSGVRTLTKAGDGTFVVVGAPLLAGVGTAAPTYTLDVGTLRVAGGELQLGLAGTTAAANSFGIRGDVENNATLVIGRRITDGARSAVQGINVSVVGNVVNAATGSLVVGVNPAFVRGGAAAPTANPFGATPAPFVVAAASPSGLNSTGSFVRVDGNLTLAGTVAVQGATGGLFEAGRAYDLFNVGGTYTDTGTLRAAFTSPFIRFALTPRVEGGRTIVSLNVVRTDFATVATDRNAASAAGALQASLPAIFGGIRGGSATADVQDLATIVAALDTQLSGEQAAQLFREISSGEIYGSLSAVSTTIPFGEATDGLPTGGTDTGVGLWFRPTGQFAAYKADREAGASEIDVSNYGGSVGLNYATGQGGHLGIAGGYGELRVRGATPERADADTYMVGVYGVQRLGGLHVSAQAVYGWSDWDVSRTLPLLGRRATAAFDSTELRGSVRVAYSVGIAPDFDLSPFARIEARRYSFDAFTEQGAGAVSLSVDKRSRTVISPEVGLRMSAAADRALRPFAEASYLFQGDVGSDRRVALASGTGQGFTVDGVDPGRSIKGAIGVAADVGGGTVFLRGDYHAGGRQQVGSVRGGLLFTF